MASRAKRGVWQRGKWWFIGGGAAGIIALLVILTSALSSSPVSSRDLGVVAPDFTGATSQGEFVLSQQRGNVQLLYFSFPG